MLKIVLQLLAPEKVLMNCFQCPRCNSYLFSSIPENTKILVIA